MKKLNLITILSMNIMTLFLITGLAFGEGDGHSLDAADGDPTDVVYVNNDGNVGINTTSPDKTLTVSGITKTNILRVGSNILEKTFIKYFPNGIANQKVDLYFDKFWGWMEVIVTSTYSHQNSPGIISKRFALGLNANGAIYSNTARYIDVQGYTPNNWAISDVTWDATNSRYRIQIVHRVSTGNTASISVRAHAGDTEKCNYIEDMGMSDIYTSDTTVYDYPEVTFPGNIGIGTTTPDYKLDVQGTIRAEEVKVETGWSDFVFEDDYNLPSLDHVEIYIKENKHLPDIPSAKEVKEQGLSVSEMMAKQMQKIEELTLYVIEQNKQIGELKEELAELKNMN